MRIKIIVLVLFVGFGLSSCNGTSSESSIAKKRIIQKIEADGMGMIKKLKIESVEKLNDSMFKGIHSFTNPLVDKDVRITRDYTFTADFDSITNVEDVKFEIKSQGEWVESGF